MGGIIFEDICRHGNSGTLGPPDQFPVMAGSKPNEFLKHEAKIGGTVESYLKSDFIDIQVRTLQKFFGLADPHFQQILDRRTAHKPFEKALEMHRMVMRYFGYGGQRKLLAEVEFHELLRVGNRFWQD